MISGATDNGGFINRRPARRSQTGNRRAPLRKPRLASLRTTLTTLPLSYLTLRYTSSHCPRYASLHPARSIPEPAPLTCAPRAPLQIFTLWKQIITSFIQRLKKELTFIDLIQSLFTAHQLYYLAGDINRFDLLKMLLQMNKTNVLVKFIYKVLFEISVSQKMLLSLIVPESK